MAARYRLGVDIGGTFTDVMVADEAGAVIATLKTPSVPGAPEEAIFTALEELRRNGEGNAWRAGVERLYGDRECRSGLSHEGSQRVLKLRAQDAEIGIGRLRGIQLGFGLLDSFVRGDAGAELYLRQVQRIPIAGDGLVE